jgi:hypothetical protein
MGSIMLVLATLVVSRRYRRLAMGWLSLRRVPALVRQPFVMMISPLKVRHTLRCSGGQLQHPPGSDERRVGQRPASRLRLAHVELEDLPPVERVAEVPLGEAPERVPRLHGDPDGFAILMSALLISFGVTLVRVPRRGLAEVVSDERYPTRPDRPAERHSQWLRVGWRLASAGGQGEHDSEDEGGDERLDRAGEADSPRTASGEHGPDLDGGTSGNFRPSDPGDDRHDVQVEKSARVIVARKKAVQIGHRRHGVRKRPADADKKRCRQADDEHEETGEASNATNELTEVASVHGAAPGPSTGTAEPVPVTVRDGMPTIERIASGWRRRTVTVTVSPETVTVP